MISYVWKLNGSVNQDHLGRVCIARFNFISECNEAKILEAGATYNGLNNIMSLIVRNTLILSNCLGFVNLLKDVFVDLIEVIFFIDEATNCALEMGDVSFSHGRCRHSVLVHSLATKALEEQGYAFLSIPYLEWFVGLVSQGVIL